MSVQIASGDLDLGGYVGETAGGTKFAVFRQGANLVAYKDIDGTPAIIGSAQVPLTVFDDTAGTIVGLDAVIDSSDVVHVVAINGVTNGNEVVYNTISDPDGTPAWGTWEQAFNYDQAPASSGLSYRVTIQVDSSDKPHLLVMETTKSMGTNRPQIYHVEKTGASWSLGEEISSSADADYLIGPRSLGMNASDDMTAFYVDSTNSDVYVNAYVSGSWGTEADQTWTNYGQPRFGSGTMVDSGATVRRYLSTQASPPLVYEEDSSTGIEVGSISGETQQFGIALNGTDRYIVFINADDDVEVESNSGSGWGSEGVEQTGTWQQAICGWSYLNLNNTAGIDYLFSNATNVWWDEFAFAGGPNTISLAGAMTSSGALKKKTSISLAGLATSSGAVAKKSFLALAGVLTSSGIIATAVRYTKALAGTLTSSGTVATRRNYFRNLAGTMASSGVVTKLTRTLKEGTMASSGTVATLRTSFVSLAGVLTSSGAVFTASRFTKALAGTLTSSGTVSTVRTSFLSLVGSLGSSGSLVKKTLKSFAGDLTSSGVLSTQRLGGLFFQALSGTMTSSGTVTTLTTRYRSFAGTLTSSGTVQKLTRVSLSGILSSAGSISKLPKLLLVGTLTSSGTLLKKTRLSLAGLLSSSGSLRKKTAIALAGAAGFGGALAKKTFLFLEGSLTSSGTLLGVKLGVVYFKALAGTLTSSGSLSKKTKKNLSGLLSSSGDISRKISKSFAGAMASSGTVATVRTAFVSLAGALTSSGTIQKLTKVSLAGLVTSSGTLAKKTYKSLAGTLASSGTLNAAKVILATSFVALNLRARSFGRTLRDREFELALRARTFALNLIKRDIE